MAEQEIDKLLLEIEVDDKTQGGSKKLVDDFATAVSKLNEQIAKLDVSKFGTITKAMSAMGNVSVSSENVKQITQTAKAIQTQSEEVKELNREIKDYEKQRKELLKERDEWRGADFAQEQKDAIEKHFAEQLKAIDEQISAARAKLPQAQGGTAPQLDEVDKQAKKIKEINSMLEVYQYKLNVVNEKLAKGGLKQEKYVALKKQQLTLENQIAKEQDKQNKSQHSGFGDALKRVAVYRAIRGILKAITDAFKEGFSNLAQYSDEVNGTLSQLNSSLTVMKNSVAVAFLPLLNAVTPLVQSLSGGIANLANAISYLSAKLHGNATYLKVNADYLKEMNKQSSLLSFDTFEKLGGGTDYSGMFEEMAVSEGFNTAELTEALSLLTGISGVVAILGSAKLIGWITSGKLAKGISSIISGLKTASGTIGIIIAGVALLASGISNLVKSWNNVNFEVWEQVVTIVTAVVAGIVGAVVAVKALTLTVPAALGLGAALTGGILLLGTELSKMTPKNYAFGGGYDSADLFYANENGQTELIASTNSGGGAVMNMQQLESAIYSGMIKAMANNSSNGESAVYLDGNKVGTFIASNSGFRSEANRRMTGLNWR